MSAADICPLVAKLRHSCDPATFFSGHAPQAEHEEQAPQEGVAWPLVVRTLAQTAQQLGACRLARFGWTKLRTLPFPPEWRVCNADALCLNANKYRY